MTTDYTGPERRHGALTEDRVQLMIQSAVSGAMTAHEHKVIAHMDAQFAALRQTFASAFPEGDPHGHRIAHEKAIRNAGWWDRIKGEAASKLLTATLWAALLFIGAAIWEHFKNEVRRP